MRSNSKEQYVFKLTKREIQLLTLSLIILIGGRHEMSFKNIKEIPEE